MEKSNSINSSKIIKSLRGLINLTINDGIIWHHNETTPNSYVSEKYQDSNIDDLFYINLLFIVKNYLTTVVNMTTIY